jgi:hypothetical protein
MENFDTQAFKDAILEIAGNDRSLSGIDFAFASIVCDILNEEFIEEEQLEAEEIVDSLQMYKRAYGELIAELEA